MGKKKEEVAVAGTNDKEAEESEEDTPVIKQLKGIDDKFCAIEVTLEEEIHKLRIKYSERQAPLLEERRKVLNDTAGASEADMLLGTPGVVDFWITAMNNCGELEQCIHECDEPVLKYLEDIQKSYLDPAAPQKGQRFELTFRKNTFFMNDVLWFEVHRDYDPETYKPYKECEVLEHKACAIDWTKNVTVEKKAKDAGKKGSRKKPAKAKEEPVPSFFSIFFTNVKKGDPLPDCLECVYEELAEEEDNDDITQTHLEMFGMACETLSDEFLPYAVRYFTGEAREDDDDDEDEESEEEDDDDEDDDDDESDEEPAPKKGGKKKPAAGKEGGEAGGQKTEECKQQ